MQTASLVEYRSNIWILFILASKHEAFTTLSLPDSLNAHALIVGFNGVMLRQSDSNEQNLAGFQTFEAYSPSLVSFERRGYCYVPVCLYSSGSWLKCYCKSLRLWSVERDFVS